VVSASGYVHGAQCVRLLGDVAGLDEIGEVPDHDAGALVEAVPDGVEAATVAYVDDDVVPALEQGGGGRLAEAVG